MRKLIIILLFFPLFTTGQYAGAAMYDTYTAPKFGVLVNSAILDNDAKIRITKDTLGCLFGRMAIITQQWDGSSSKFDKFTDSAISMAVNINYSANGSGEPFPTGTALNNYIDTFQLIVTKYPNIGLAVWMNEEQNQTYHSGPITNYCKGLQRAYPIARAAGIPLTNGGLNGYPIATATYRWVQVYYSQAQADSFGAACMSKSQITAAKNPGSDPTTEFYVRQIDTLLSYSPYVDYWNIHSYQPTNKQSALPDTFTAVSPYVFRYEAEYLTKNSGGKPVITNETGMRDNSDSLLTRSMLQMCVRLGTQWFVFFDGVDQTSGTYGLTNDTTGAILPTGIAWKYFIQANQAN